MAKLALLFGAVTWSAVAALGFWSLAVYETRPGSPASPSEDWPGPSRLAREPDRWTLVLFLHPRCPCSGASLDELAALLADKSRRLRARIVVCQPSGVPEGWEKTALWRRACGMDGADVVCDDLDQERRTFGVLTSGQVLLYDRQGRLWYSGGITRARGQVGPNLGRAAVEALSSDGSSSVHSRPVFGCPLVGPDESCLTRGGPCPNPP